MLDYTKWVLASTLVAFLFQLNPPIAATTPAGRAGQASPCHFASVKALNEAIETLTNSSLTPEGTLLNEPQRTKNMRPAIAKFERASKMFRECNDNLSAAISLNYAAEVYSRLGEKQKALEYYKRALSLAQTEKTPSSTSTQNFIFMKIREIYSDLEKNKKR